MKKALITAILFFVFITPLVSAQLTEYFTIPVEYTTSPEIFHMVIIPFIGTFVVIWGILNRIKIRRMWGAIISFIITLALLFTGYLFILVDYLFNSYGILAVDAFFIIVSLVVGIWGFRRVGLVAFTETIGEKYKDERRKTSREVGRLRYIDDQLRKKEREVDRLEKERSSYSTIAKNLSGYIRRGDIPRRVWIEIQNKIGKSFRKPSDALNHLNKKIRTRDNRIADLEVEITKLKTERTKISGRIKEKM